MSDKHNAVDAAALDEVMKKYDRESNTRIWEGWQKWAVYGVMAAVSVFVIYVTLFATWLDLVRYPSFLGAMLFIGYLIYPVKKGVQKVNHIPWYDLVIMVLGTAAFFYVVVNAKDLTVRLGVLNVKKYEIYIGIVGVLAVMELCRRSTGIPILCVASAFLIYAIYYYVGVKGLGVWKATRQLTIGLFYNTTGLLTTPIQVCSKFIVVFIVFGAFLERTGISNFFIDLANSAAGAAAGGPAKVAVISSALCGMVSGSSVGNTVTTGSVTIPMMQRTGYKGEFAGAVEAAASTGGQIMPPIMGAAAFLMADYVGVPYSDIIGRAILPAFLYFAGIFISVHLEAKKLGLKGIDRSELPTAVSLVKKLYLLLPLIILVYLVSSGKRTMAFAAAISVVFTVVVSNLESNPLPSGLGILLLLCYLFAPLNEGVGAVVLCMGLLLTAISMLKKDAKMTPALFFDALANGAFGIKNIFESLQAGGRGCISVGVACGIAGIIAGCITMTGLASQIISVIIRISGGTKIVALVLTMLCCIVLGMGVPTTANYCIMASTCAPILVQLGFPVVAAHFFVFYFGIVADITPPVALAAYAGSAIAKSNPMRTGINASKLAIAAFIVPYVFCYSPALLFENISGVFEVLQICVTALIGIFGVAACLNGYLFKKINVVFRVLLLAGGLTLIYPGLATDVIGLALVGVVFAIQYLTAKRSVKAAA